MQVQKLQVRGLGRVSPLQTGLRHSAHVCQLSLDRLHSYAAGSRVHRYAWPHWAAQ